MSWFKDFMAMLNEPPIRVKSRPVRAGAMTELFRRYMLPHWPRLLVAVILTLAVHMTIFCYAWSSRYIADEIVQIDLIKYQSDKAQYVEPGWENQRFSLEDDRARNSWTRQLDDKPGLSNAQKLHRLSWLVVLMFGIVLADRVFNIVLWNQVITVGLRLQYLLRQRLFYKLQTLPMSYHDKHSTGYLMTHLFSDVQVVQQSAMHLLVNVPGSILQVLVGIIILLSIDPGLSVVVFIALPTYAAAYRLFHPQLKTLHRNLRERQGLLDAHINNRVRNFYVVKSFVRETFEAVDLVRRVRPIIRNTLGAQLLGTFFVVSCGIISGVCMVAVLWLGALRVRDGVLTTGNLLLFYAAAGQMFSPISSLSQLAGMVHRLRAVATKVMGVLDEPIALLEPLTPRDLPEEAPRIDFSNVSFTYGGGEEPVLQNVTFSLPAGQSLCIMGPSGSGKTTLAKLACRIYDPTVGTVRMNGSDIREFKLADLRGLVGFVPQEPVIFDGTIDDNIRYGSEGAFRRDIIASAQFARIHEFIERLPDRYQTMTSERGLNLSGGQKQRLNLARVLLYNPKVLVLDDCTSALDAETEAKLMHGFETALKGRTVILVSQRVSIAMRCDLVIMLKSGKIVEMGNPQELMDRGGLLADLCAQQAESTSLVAG
ncbi:MAG: ABC transporter ATP-binding protein [Planctomycetes bacterium]|jgi:subfamily B ATP-binding cassette protein MsbA|nr:ABC transporter ATP-binding protein [Planctomycetota bacterium]